MERVPPSRYRSGRGQLEVPPGALDGWPKCDVRRFIASVPRPRQIFTHRPESSQPSPPPPWRIRMTEVTTGAGSPAPGGGPRRSRRLVALVLVSLTVLASGAVAAIATVVNPPGVNRGHLVAVGPTSGDNGFPVWYKDDNNVRVEPCIDANDPNCVAAAPLPDPSQPISFPDN